MSIIGKKRYLYDIYDLEESIFYINYSHSTIFSKKDVIDLTKDDNNSDSDSDYEYLSDYDDDEYKKYKIDDENKCFFPSLKRRRVGKYNFKSNNNKSKIENFENNINKEKSQQKSSDNDKKKRKCLTYKQKNQLLEKQKYKCANYPESGIIKTKDHQHYCCPFWKLDNGIFDESGYEADHIDEFNKSNNNSINNFQLLCSPCHSVKTKRCAQYSWKYSTQEMDRGQRPMEVR